MPPPPASPGLANAPAQRLSLVEYRDTPLSEAIRLFSEQTGLNVVASPDARKIPVSLYLRNVTAETALATLCKSNSLWFRQDAQSGVVTIYTTKEYQSDLASFREEQTEVFTLLYPNPVDVATAIRSIYGNRVVLNTESQWQDVYQDLEERFDRFDIVDGRSQGLGLFQGGTGAGLGGTSGGYGTGGLGGTGYGGAGGAYGGRGGGYAGQGAGGYAGVRRQDLLSENRAARQETTKQIPPREEFKNLSPEEIETLEAARTGEGKVNQAVLEALLARRQATIYVTVIRAHNQLIVRTGDEKTMTQIVTGRVKSAT